MLLTWEQMNDCILQMKDLMRSQGLEFTCGVMPGVRREEWEALKTKESWDKLRAEESRKMSGITEREALARAICKVATDEFWEGIWWVPDGTGNVRNATPGECATEIQRLRAALAEICRSPIEARSVNIAREALCL